MKLAEICGPSGIGKSTIYKAMLERGGFIQPPQPSLSEAKAIIAAAAPQHPDIAAFAVLLGRIFRNARGDIVSARRSRTWRNLAKVALCRERGDGVMVLDGGLVQRGQAVDRLITGVPIEDYYRTMPAPDLVVSLCAPVTRIKERNRCRGGVQDRGYEADQSAKLHALARGVLWSRGIRVEVVDAERSPAVNAARILGMIHAL